MRKIDHAPKYIRSLSNRIKNNEERKGIRKIIWKNKIHVLSIAIKARYKKLLEKQII
jgi:hypothetical protein